MHTFLQVCMKRITELKYGSKICLRNEDDSSEEEDSEEDDELEENSIRTNEVPSILEEIPEIPQDINNVSCNFCHLTFKKNGITRHLLYCKKKPIN